MKKNTIKSIFVVAVLAATTSCTTLNQSMREPNSHVEFTKADFTLSEQVSAEAKTTTILNLDLERLFKKEMGQVNGGVPLVTPLTSIPVIGPVVGGLVSDKTANYALYNLMTANPGYDVVFYPQYKIEVVKPILGIGFLIKTVNVKTTARLGKLK